MPPKSKLWPREPHTEGKHLVLRRYLNAWLPILGSWNGRILFIDGFAGPGEYSGGEEGSPLIAMRALIEHSARKLIKAEVVFLFIEADARRAQHLEGLVNALAPQLPPKSKAQVIQGDFDRSLKEVLDYLDDQRKRMAPAFVMVDPFGVAGTPMEIIARILQNRRCEVYISFMYEGINRFISTPEFAPHLTDLFGTDAWKAAIDLTGDDRQIYLYSLYESSLRSAGARHVVHFDLCKENRLIYSIFFGSEHPKGCDVMKRAIWSVAPFGDYTFKGARGGQLLFDLSGPNLEPLRGALCGEFAPAGWVGIQTVLDFVASDATEYHTGHVKKLLKKMERSSDLEVQEGTRKSRYTYPEGSLLKFHC